MIKYYLLKLSFVWNFHSKKYVQFSLTPFGTGKQDYVIKETKAFSFLPLIKSSVTI